MHQSGHSRAHSMQTVQFSSVKAMTPRLRGGSCGAASGYCAVTARLVSRLKVVANPCASPRPAMAPIFAVHTLGYEPPRLLARDGHVVRYPRRRDGDLVIGGSCPGVVSRRDPSDDAPAPSGSLVPHRVEERIDGTRAAGRPIDEQVVQVSADAAVERADERAQVRDPYRVAAVRRRHGQGDDEPVFVDPAPDEIEALVGQTLAVELAVAAVQTVPGRPVRRLDRPDDPVTLRCRHRLTLSTRRGTSAGRPSRTSSAPATCHGPSRS